jgi:hypothetical protein
MLLFLAVLNILQTCSCYFLFFSGITYHLSGPTDPVYVKISGSHGSEYEDGCLLDCCDANHCPDGGGRYNYLKGNRHFEGSLFSHLVA